MDRIIKSTIIVSIIRIFDMITTYMGVTKFGIEAELNPLLSLQMGIFGNILNSLIFHYFLGIALVYGAFWLIDRTDKKREKAGKRPTFNGAKWSLIIIFSLAVINNLVQYYFIK